MKMPTLIFHGHACFEMRGDSGSCIIDPFLSGNPQADVGPEDISVDAILVTHAHSDHLGDAIEIARRTGATIISTYELALYCQQQGAASVHPMHIGGERTFEWGRVKLTPALHGSSLPEKGIWQLGVACGFLVTIDGSTVYHPGDTGLMSDMQLIGRLENIVVALLPIGGNFTMDATDAIEAAKMLRPDIVVPMHYNTFDVIAADPEQFARRLEAIGHRCHILRPGESLQF